MPYTTTNITEDLVFGVDREPATLDLLQGFFGAGMTRSIDQYARYDYHDEDNGNYAELKSRRIRHDRYPDTVIGYNKIRDAPIDKNVYLLFGFTDGIWGCKIDDRIRSLRPRTFYRNNGEVKYNVNIPITWLSPVRELLA